MRHELAVLGPLVDTRRAAEVVERDRVKAAFGEAERELLVEGVEAPDVRQDHDAGRDVPIWQRPERRELVAVLAFEDEVVVGDGGARDLRDRRLGVELEAHGAASVRKEARAVRRTLRAVDDESQRDEMNAAIRAQRERGAVPRSMLPPEDELPERPPPPPERPPTLGA